MARARNIKPAFFDNDELAENHPLGRLLFIGLWTLADCNGNLEWRPKRIKKQLLAYDDCCIESLAINLDKSGFIRFYSDGEKMYVNVINFDKHQNPHKNERQKGSDVPEFKESMRQAIDLNGLAINLDESGLKHECSNSNPADSLNLIPDSLNLIPDKKRTLSSKDDRPNEIFNYWCDVMQKDTSKVQFTKERAKKVKERLKDGYTVEFIKQAIYGCSITPHNNGTDPSGNGQRYDDLELICRNATKLETFAEKALNPTVLHASADPFALSAKDDWTEGNLGL